MPFIASGQGDAEANQHQRFRSVEQLRDHVVSRVRRRQGVKSVTPNTSDPAQFTTEIGDKSIVSDVTNIYGRIKAYPEDDADILIDRFVGIIDESRRRTVNRDNVVAVLRTEAFVEQLASTPAPMRAEPFVDELRVVFMVETSDSMSPLNASELVELAAAELRVLALTNVSKWLDRVVSDGQLGAATLYYVDGNSLLSPSLILLEEFWTSIERRYAGDVLIALPRRDQLFIIDDTTEGLAMARAIIKVTIKDDFSILSDKLFARRDKKIVVVEE